MSSEQTEGDKTPSKPWRFISIIFTVGVSVPVLISSYLLLYNNVSTKSDQRFTEDLSRATTDAMLWAVDNEKNLLGGLGYINIELLRMLQDCSDLRYTPAFDNIIKKFMASNAKPECDKAMLDPNWPIDTDEINEVFDELIIDYQWELYALSPGKISANPKELDFFNPNRWQGRQLTHQLWGLILYRERNECGREVDVLIEHLCDRLSAELNFDISVVDIYIQKVAFVLKAGHPEKIRRRWIERIIENQNFDGGWDDKWLCFTSTRRPRFRRVNSNQHASIQAFWVLCQVRYRYPDLFGVNPEYN
ncbi:MAG: hypothetical protein H8E62_05980 [Planctomycetes bacterium]|nr:hypothetical protein [Planctomycetota bacterium]